MVQQNYVSVATYLDRWTILCFGVRSTAVCIVHFSFAKSCDNSSRSQIFRTRSNRDNFIAGQYLMASEVRNLIRSNSFMVGHSWTARSNSRFVSVEPAGQNCGMSVIFGLVIFGLVCSASVVLNFLLRNLNHVFAVRARILGRLDQSTLIVRY